MQGLHTFQWYSWKNALDSWSNINNSVISRCFFELRALTSCRRKTFGTGVDRKYSAELYVADQILHCRNHRESIKNTFTLQIIDTVKIKNTPKWK